MKLLFANCNPVNRESLPVRGAWIEIRYTNSANNTSKSLPVRGAWIEIFPMTRFDKQPLVAPRAGSVD